MAGLVQNTVDAFYSQLNSLGGAARAERAALLNQRDELQHRYSTARSGNDAAEMKRLEPLIHENSRLRLRYTDVVGKFNSMLKAVSGLLAKAGITAPAQLSGVGVAPLLIIVPAAVVTTAAITWGIVHEIQAGRLKIASLIASGALPPGYEAQGDPLANLGKDATTIALIIGAVILLPHVLKAVKGRT